MSCSAYCVIAFVPVMLHMLEAPFSRCYLFSACIIDSTLRFRDLMSFTFGDREIANKPIFVFQQNITVHLWKVGGIRRCGAVWCFFFFFSRPSWECTMKLLFCIPVIAHQGTLSFHYIKQLDRVVLSGPLLISCCKHCHPLADFSWSLFYTKFSRVASFGLCSSRGDANTLRFLPRCCRLSLIGLHTQMFIIFP